MVLQAYLYHNWESLLILVWVSHSFLDHSMKRFSRVTQRVYVPLMVLNFLFYYIMNVNQLFSAEFLNEKGLAAFGIFTFQVPILEVCLLQLNIFCLFFWCKKCQSLTE